MKMLEKIKEFLKKQTPGNAHMGLRVEADIIVRSPDGKIKARRKIRF